MKALGRIPKIAAHAGRAARKGEGRIGLAAFEHAHSLAGFGQSVGHDGAAKAGANHHRVEVFRCRHEIPPRSRASSSCKRSDSRSVNALSNVPSWLKALNAASQLAKRG